MEVRRSLRGLCLGLALVACLPAPAAAQGRSRVVLLRPAADQPAMREALTRLDAELRTAGFEVTTIDRSPDQDVRATLEREAAAAGAFAAIAILPTSGGTAADVWIVDRATDKAVVRTVQAPRRPGESAPSILAIRAVELLRASLLEADAPSPPPATPRRAVPADVARWMTPPPPARELRLGVGASMLHAFDGIGPAFAPTVRVSWGTPTLAARLSITVPAIAPAIAVDAGEVAVRQELAALEAVFSRAIGGTRLVPRASVGAGAYHLAAFGALDPPARSAADEAWAIFFASGIGLGVQVTETVAPHLDVQAIFTEPRPVVIVGGEAVGRAGRPSILATLGLEVRL